jgi:hypothetical protein
MVYKTVGELVAAYEQGALKREELLFMHGDSAVVYKGGRRMFKMSERRLLVELLDYVGIPWDDI